MNNKQICFREKSAERKAAVIEDEISDSYENLKQMILDHVKANVAHRVALRRAGVNETIKLEIV